MQLVGKYKKLLSKEEMQLLPIETVVKQNDFEYVYAPHHDTFLLLSVLKQEIKTFPKCLTIAELGSGTGIISANVNRWLSLEKNTPLLHVSIDINPDASELSYQLYSNYNLKIEQVNTSLFGSTRMQSLKPEVVIFNPPYVAVETEEMQNELKYLKAKLQSVNRSESIRSKQTNMIAYSYMGGIDGLAVTRRFIHSLNWECIAYFIVMGEEGVTSLKQEIASKSLIHGQYSASFNILQFHQFYNELLYVIQLKIYK